MPERDPKFGEGCTADATFIPFSNGTEHLMWLSSNCERGKGCRNYNPDASSSKNGCPMEVGMALAAASDGHMKAQHGLRCGLLEPGADGLLWRVTGTPCPEYRGRDEPDDRPRRSPKPPADQLDLLDPRNTPTRTEVHA